MGRERSLYVYEHAREHCFPTGTREITASHLYSNIIFMF